MQLRSVVFIGVVVAAACGKDKGKEAPKAEGTQAAGSAAVAGSGAAPTPAAAPVAAESSEDLPPAKRKACSLLTPAEVSEIVGTAAILGDGGGNDDCEYVTNKEDGTSVLGVKLQAEKGLLKVQRETNPKGDVAGVGDAANYLSIGDLGGQMVIEKGPWTLMLTVSALTGEPNKARDMRPAMDKLVAKAMPRL